MLHTQSFPSSPDSPRSRLEKLNVAPMVTMTCKGVFDGTLTLKVWNTVLIATMVIMTGNWSEYLLVFGLEY